MQLNNNVFLFRLQEQPLFPNWNDGKERQKNQENQGQIAVAGQFYYSKAQQTFRIQQTNKGKNRSTSIE